MGTVVSKAPAEPGAWEAGSSNAETAWSTAVHLQPLHGDDPFGYILL